jgi:hypothetical protein
MKIKSLMLMALIVLNFGCKSSSSTTAAATSTGGTSGVLSVSQLAGDANSACTAIPGSAGSAFSGYYYISSLHSNSSGSGYYSLNTYSNSACNGTGINAFGLTLWGTYSTAGSATSPSGATNLIFTVSSVTITPHTATWATNLATACGGSFTSGSNTTVTGLPCSGSGTISAMNFAGASDTHFNVGTLSGTTFSISTPTSVWSFGNATYPTSTGFNLIF